MYPVFTKLGQYRFIPLLLVLGLLTACGSVPQKSGAPDQAGDNSVKREFAQALALMQANDMQAAAEKFHDLTARYPQMTGAWANLGRIHMKAGEWKQAQHALQQAINLNPGHASAYNYLGVVLRNLGQFSEAEQAYKNAISADPTYALAWLNLGILYDIYLDKPAQALSQYEKYQQLKGNADKKVAKWIIEIKRRIPKKASTAPRSGDEYHV